MPTRIVSGLATAVLTVCLCWGCATGKTGKVADKDAAAGTPSKQTAPTAPKAEPPATQPDTKAAPGTSPDEDPANQQGLPRAGTLAAATRTLLGRSEVSIALMNGLENRYVGEAPEAQDMPAAMEALAAAAQCRLQATPEYYFVYPADPRYDPLTKVTLGVDLPPAYKDITTDVTFSAGTKLFTVLAALGQASGRTFVADNGLAESLCGEIAIRQAPVTTALEALLKSARVAGFRTECTDEYVLFLSPRNASQPNLLLNPDSLTASQKAFLERRVTVHLPAPPSGESKLVVTPGAEHLKAVLESLSDQLRVPVTAEKQLEEFPVNPAVFTNVRVRTLMDLILRQWPLPGYGYEVQSDRILIRAR